ncbi:MAG: hypothetical protein C0403_10380 [Desulfobacterium sp.]|nr:hypothetical protein [Desulfobacterium sp.]
MTKKLYPDYTFILYRIKQNLKRRKMEKQLQYTILEKIDDAFDSTTYRCQRDNQKEKYIIQILKTTFLSSTEIAQFKREYNRIQNTGLKGVIKIHDVINYDGSCALILENFNGTPLKNLLNGKKLLLEPFFKIVTKLCETIGNLHKNGIIHKNIKPQSIVLDERTQEVGIMDFGVWSMLRPGRDDIYNQDFIQSTLAYISPEQTGRMNRSIDYRSDLYSMGVLFYEMLTGAPPFLSSDPMEVIYSHIARKPIPIEDIDQTVPIILSDIVMKLLSKTVEGRYQNSFGLLSDLQECARQLAIKNRIDWFEIAKHDFPIKYIQSYKLIGREDEMAFLLKSFESIGPDSNRIILISGPPGIGKSALVYEFQKKLFGKGCYFISGKYDQLRQDLPYSAIVESFQELIRKILTESKENISEWRRKLYNALGSNGKVITDIIPEVELIIGKQPDLIELGADELKNRFEFLFEKFIGVFLNNPLIFFLDDLQWADIASIRLIQKILTSNDLKNILLIAAVRDSKEFENDSLTTAVQEIGKKGIAIDRLTLSPLNHESVKTIMIDFLHCDDEKADALTTSVHKKTRGNPFFLNQFLQKLYDQKILEIDSVLGWIWDIDKINRMQVTDNVLELMSSRINKLSESTQQVLKLCSCIGDKFTPETISSLRAESIDKTLIHLNEATNEGLLYFLDKSFCFHHDKIMEVFYLSIPENERSSMHYQIGKLSLKKCTPDELNNRLFYIVNQLNLGSGLITDSKEKEELSLLNLRAGKKARASVAYSSADRYLTISLDLLDKDCWSKQYDLALAIHTEAIETTYLMGDFERMNRLADAAVKEARKPIDLVGIYITKINAGITQDNFHSATLIGINFLRQLGMNVPERPGFGLLFFEYLKSRVTFTITKNKVKDAMNWPEMVDPVRLSYLKIFSSLGLAAYFDGNFNFCIFLMFKSINLFGLNSFHPETPGGFVNYGMILIASFHDIDGGYRFGRLGLQMLDRTNPSGQKARTVLTYNSTIHHWKRHIQETHSSYMEAYHVGLETGDVTSAAASLCNYDITSFSIGRKLEEIEKEAEKHNRIIKGLNQLGILRAHSIHWQMVLNLLGRNADPTQLTGEAFNEHETISLLDRSNQYFRLMMFWVTKAYLCSLFYKPKEALEYIEQSEKHINVVLGMTLIRSINILDSLVRLSLYPESSKKQQKNHLKKVAKNQKKKKKWADFAPMNNLHEFNFIEAERARVLGKDDVAARLYDLAIQQSQQHRFPITEAAVNERAAHFYNSRGNHKRAKAYMTEAYSIYAEWGAVAKLKHLRESYPKLFSSSPLTAYGSEYQLGNEKTAFDALDLLTMLKASQALSGEIRLEKLLRKLMQILMENAGAQIGSLILKNRSMMVVEAECSMNSSEVKILQSIPVTEASFLCVDIVNYVARTKKSVILNDAANEGSFVNVPYIQKNNVKSVLCSPLLNQGRLIGVLYLENNLSIGAFTSTHLKFLQLLSGQAAISVENARYYKLVVQSEEKYRLLYENAVEGIFQIASDGRLISANPALAKIFGYDSPEEMISLVTNVEQQIFVDMDVSHEINRYLSDNERLNDYILQCYRKDKSKVWISISARTVHDPNKHLICYEGSLIDVTERKEAEIKMIRSQKLATLGQIMAGIAHEINNPNNFIFFNIPTLKKYISKIKVVLSQNIEPTEHFQIMNMSYHQFFEDLFQLIEDMEMGTSRINSIVSGLKNYVRSHKEEGKKPESLSEIIKHAMTLVGSQLNQKIRQVEVHVANDLPPVYVNAGKIEQVLINLLINASQAADKEDSRICLTVKPYEKGDSMITIMIEDNGKGIPENIAGKIFDPFFSTGNSKTGTGLGLSISQGIIEESKGELSFHSEPGKGSTFHVRIPVYKTDEHTVIKIGL